MYIFIVLQTILVTVISIPLFDQFDYAQHGDDWKQNPFCWQEGRATNQSPIDIIQFPQKKNFDNTYFFPAYKQLKVRAQYFNYSLMVTPEDYKAYSGDLYTKYPNELQTKAKFSANETFFRVPAEHTVDGVRNDLEVQVYHNRQLVTGQPYAYAAVSVFFKIGNKENLFLKSIIDAKTANQDIFDLDYRNLISFYDKQDFVSYQGSFSQPRCSQFVNWYVLKTVHSMTKEQFDFFQTKYPFGNYRNIQPVEKTKLITTYISQP